MNLQHRTSKKRLINIGKQ